MYGSRAFRRFETGQCSLSLASSGTSLTQVGSISIGQACPLPRSPVHSENAAGLTWCMPNLHAHCVQKGDSDDAGRHAVWRVRSAHVLLPLSVLAQSHALDAETIICVCPRTEYKYNCN